jgi:hypothetical protein
MDDVVDIFTHALADPPEGPPACTALLLGLSHLLNERVNEGRKTQLQEARINPQIMRFLATPRPGVFLPQFKTTVERCRCKESRFLMVRAPWGLHSYGDAPDRHLARFIDVISGDLAFLLGRKRHLKLYRAPTGGGWPQRREDLLRGDPNEDFIILTMWLNLPDPVPMQGLSGLIQHTIHMFKASVLLGVLKSPALLGWVERCGQMAYSRASRSSRAAVDVNPRTTKNTIMLVKDSGDVLRVLNNLLFPEELLLWTTGDGRSSRDLFIRSCDLATAGSHIAATRAGEHGFEISAALDEAVHSGVKGWTAFAARVMHGDPLCIPEHMTQTMRADLADLQNRAKDPYYCLLDAGFGPQWAHRCHAPGCLMAYVAAGRRFQSCGGCRSATYCSRACQRRAWNHFAAPHRKVCAISGQVQGVLREFEREPTRHRVLQAEISEKRARLACERFDALRAAKFTYLRKSDAQLPLPNHSYLSMRRFRQAAGCLCRGRRESVGGG